MLAVACVALVAAAAAIAGTRAACGVSKTALLEALPRARAGGARAALDAVIASDARGARRAVRPIAIGPESALELRGWASDDAGSRAGAVFAVLDGGRAYRADYGAAPQAPNPPRRDGRPPFDVVIPASGLARGEHEIRLRVVARSLDAYAEPLPPVAFTVR